jgi:hypothetical protein
MHREQLPPQAGWTRLLRSSLYLREHHFPNAYPGVVH